VGRGIAEERKMTDTTETLTTKQIRKALAERENLTTLIKGMLDGLSLPKLKVVGAMVLGVDLPAQPEVTHETGEKAPVVKLAPRS
jgi:hypothetical protein